MSDSQRAAGIDVGGTFTDCVFVGDDGRLSVSKVITTADQSEGAAAAVAALGVPIEGIGTIVHGTTVATNAILERKGAVVGLLTTEGFRDVLEFQRQDRRDIWNLFSRKVEPLVPRRLRLEVRERMMADGSVHQPLDEASARDAARRLVAAGVQAIAVCLINAYRNPAHERRLEEILAEEAPGLHVALSCRIAPHFREYERMSTTVLSAYVGPKISSYLSDFRGQFARRRFAGQIFVMGSNGGVLPPETSGRHAATTCLSGPAGGVLATLEVARQLGIRDAISFDMGGTSTDVCLIEGGTAATATRAEIGGLPISLPQIKIETVSAGGGSIARIDSGGLLHVGPQSAGSRPGPACYGFGGTLPTVTDAAYLMGLLRASTFFGGRMALDRAAASAALGPLATRLGESVEAVAEKVFTIANVKMANAVRLVSVREGHDPRDFSLFAFGGAGPLHACAVADDLGIPRVVVPVFPGAFSAFGLLCADLERDFVRSDLRPFSALDDAALDAAFGALLEEARGVAAEMGAGAARWHRTAEMRYRGQAYEVQVPLARGPARTQRLLADFHARHRRQFGFSEPGSEVELVNLRVKGRWARRKPSFAALPGTGEAPEGEAGTIQVGGRPGACRFHARDALPRGATLAGPAVVEESTATTFVPAGWRLTVTEFGHLDLRRA
ncbi:MAG: hydantoinase/oxoprolinase family protein [Dongiaceae bacterium]